MTEIIDWSVEYMALDIPRGEKIQQAIARHKADLEKPDFPYEYRPELANVVIDFIELLPEPSTGLPMQLALFQKFILSQLYGWVHKETGFRKYTKAYLSMSRKQGKSLLVSGIALYELIYERNPMSDRQIYATANSREQAKIVFGMVERQLRALRDKSPAIAKSTKMVQNLISFRNDEGIIKPLAKDVGSLDGLNVLLGILDEYHSSPTTEMMEVLESSMVQQKEPMIIIISTAGNKLNAPMYTQEYPYATKILSGEVEADNYLALIWEQDSEAEVLDPKTWPKSNPLLEIESVQDTMMEYLKNKLREAQEKQDLGLTFTKNFNLWQSASTASFLKGDEWTATNLKSLGLATPALEGRDVYIGLDLSRTNDISAVSWVVPIEETGQMFIDTHGFIATKGGLEAKMKRDKTNYRQLEQHGFCSITTKESGIIDYKDIVSFIKDFISSNELNLKAICYDPYNVNSIITDLEDDYGDKLIEVRQGYVTLSPAIKQLRLDVYDKVVVHDNNPMLNMSVSNAVVVWQNDALLIDKKTNREKIDCLAGVVNAYSQAQYHVFNEIDPNEFYTEDNFSF